MARATSSATRKVVGLGFLPEEARHGFLIDIPKGSGSSEFFLFGHAGMFMSCDNLELKFIGHPFVLVFLLYICVSTLSAFSH